MTESTVEQETMESLGSNPGREFNHTLSLAPQFPHLQTDSWHYPCSPAGLLQRVSEVRLFKAPRRPVPGFPFGLLCHVIKLFANAMTPKPFGSKEFTNIGQTGLKIRSGLIPPGSLESGITSNTCTGWWVCVYSPTLQTPGEIPCFCFYELLKQ